MIDAALRFSCGLYAGLAIAAIVIAFFDNDKRQENVINATKLIIFSAVLFKLSTL